MDIHSGPGHCYFPNGTQSLKTPFVGRATMKGEAWNLLLYIFFLSNVLLPFLGFPRIYAGAVPLL